GRTVRHRARSGASSARRRSPDCALPQALVVATVASPSSATVMLSASGDDGVPDEVPGPSLQGRPDRPVGESRCSWPLLPVAREESGVADRELALDEVACKSAHGTGMNPFVGVAAPDVLGQAAVGPPYGIDAIARGADRGGLAENVGDRGEFLLRI